MKKDVISSVFNGAKGFFLSNINKSRRLRKLLVLTSPCCGIIILSAFMLMTIINESWSILKKSKTASPQALAAFSSYGLLLFLCVYPFFLPDHYFKMTFGKTMFFYFAVLIYVVGCLLISAFTVRKTPSLRTGSHTDLYFAAFLLTAVIAWAASDYRSAAFSGEEGRYMGLLTFLFIGGAYLFVTRYGQITKPVACIFGASMIFMSVVSLLQFRGFDPFSLYKGTQQTVRINFMSLVGNKDVYYSYLALTVPFAMYLACTAEKMKEQLFWLAAAFFGFGGAFACNSEGVYLALIPAFALLFFTGCRDKDGLLRLLRCLIAFFAAALLAAVIKPDLSSFGIIESAVLRHLVRPIPCLCALAATALLHLAAAKLDPPPVFYKCLRILVAVLLGAALAALLAAFVCFTFFDKERDLGSLTEFFRFDGVLWGNKRGYVWTRLLQLYREFPLPRKLIGSGEETAGILLKNAFGAEMKQKTGLTFDNAHNEFLQYLVTHGLLGLVSYLLLVSSAIRDGVKTGGRYQKAAALCCVCYLAQSFVNISQSITTPLFFVFLALTQTADWPAEVPAVSPESPAKKNGNTARKTAR